MTHLGITEALHPLQRVPLELVAEILAELDSTRQLASAILSHSVFLDAFNENRLSIITGIIKNQIPANLIAFASALHESNDVDAKDYDAVCSCLTRLTQNLSDPVSTMSSLTRSSMSKVAMISKTHEAIELMCQDFANMSIPLLNDRLGIDHPPQASQTEKFRLCRAFYRYQLMCNFFCLIEQQPLSEEERKRRFCHDFSPWVNEQVVCVSAYLQAKVHKAFDELAAHDVEWGKLSIGRTIDAISVSLIQAFLSQDLHLLSAVCLAQSYDEWVTILRLDSVIHRSIHLYPMRQLYEMALDERVLEPYMPADEYQSEESIRSKLAQLAQPLDGAEDTALSSPFKMWFITHMDTSMIANIFTRRDEILWDCGYVIWDIPEGCQRNLVQKIEETGTLPLHFKRHRWPVDEMARSQRRRADIWLSGGRGYWPREGNDFSRVHGLDEESKIKLLDKWRLGAENSSTGTT